MKALIVIILLCLYKGVFAQNNTFNAKYNTFKLTYMIIGMGPNGSSKWPVFEVKGTEFIYIYDLTGWTFRDSMSKPDTICSGYLRLSSIDSLLDLVSNRKDTLVYKWNQHIIDGLRSYLYITKDSLKIEFRLNNSGDSDAERIVNILNSNIPNDKRKLLVCCDHKRNKKEE